METNQIISFTLNKKANYIKVKDRFIKNNNWLLYFNILVNKIILKYETVVDLTEAIKVMIVEYKNIEEFNGGKLINYTSTLQQNLSSTSYIISLLNERKKREKGG